MAKCDDCEQTVSPEFECEEPCELTSTDCAIYENAITYLSLEENSTMTEVIDALLSSLINARNRIEQIEQNCCE